MDTKDAIELDIKNSVFNNGSLSRHLYGNENTLRHKVDGYKGSVLHVEDIMRIMEATGSRETIKALAQSLGGVFIQLPEENEEIENQDLMLKNQQIVIKLGEFFNKYATSISDGTLSIPENKSLKKDIFDIASELLGFLAISDLVYGERVAK